MKAGFLKTATKFSIAAALYGLVLLYEKWRPLRKATQPKIPRVLRNLSIGLIGTLALRGALYPLLIKLSQWTVGNGWGVLSFFDLPKPAHTVLAFLLLDYTLYVWHWLNHNVAFLWRFHNAHHVDLDLDISTASRFHFGELTLSAIPRSIEILLFGIDPFSMILFDSAVIVAANFHHSNMNLPIHLEKFLSYFVVTPRMHGIHHSIVQRETNSNYSTVFLFWDHLHRTLHLNIPQSAVTIGVASYRDPRELTLIKVLLLPFRAQRPWQFPNGTYPERQEAGIATKTVIV